jgi:hypothetical protein
MNHIHNYEIVREYKDGMLEICIECKKQLITRWDPTGKMDHVTYLKEHVRDTCQPTGPTAQIYERFYGNKTN